MISAQKLYFRIEMKQSIFSLMFGLLSTCLFAQSRWLPTAGIRTSLLFSFGTHSNHLGIKLDSYIGNQYIQLNGGLTLRYHLTDLGQRSNFGEMRFSTGGVIMFGKPTNAINMDWDGPLHQSTSPFSIGYAHYWYLDQAKTTQRSGAWNLGLKNIDILFENDVFAGQSKDRFRTGALHISYRDSLVKSGIGLSIWTGETAHSTWDKTPKPGAPNGYRDITPNLYGKTSSGIFYYELKYQFYPLQTAGGRIGWDSEQVRHIFQNKISHDLVLLPKKMKRNTPHYPRLSKEGNVVFTKEEARKAKFYFQTFINDGLLY